MIELTYYYSACVGFRTPDVSVLCDPWFTDGIYDGSWFQFPKMADPLAKIGRYDVIYISHIQPDHYDRSFLSLYLAEFPETQIVIADTNPNYLSREMKREGFIHETVRTKSFGDTEICIVPNVNDEPTDIDSAFAIKTADGHSIVNLNDNPYNQKQVDILQKFAGRPKIALLGYSGAGPFPQTYYTDPHVLEEKAAEKKKLYFERYLRYAKQFNAEVNIPFAGKYILGSKLIELNQYRGVPDQVEVLAIDPHAVVLADGGQAKIDTKTLTPTAVRGEPYSAKRLKERLSEIRDLPFDEDLFFNDSLLPHVPFERLLKKSYDNAIRKSCLEEDYYFSIRLGEDRWFTMNGNRIRPEALMHVSPPVQTPRTEIEIPLKYLFGLMTGVFHWNNAYVGSKYTSHRVPDTFHREAHLAGGFLNFFHC